MTAYAVEEPEYGDGYAPLARLDGRGCHILLVYTVRRMAEAHARAVGGRVIDAEAIMTRYYGVDVITSTTVEVLRPQACSYPARSR